MRMIQTVWVSLSCRIFLGSISTVIEASCPLIQFERERFMIECILRGLGIPCGSSIYIRHIFATTPIHVRLKETHGEQKRVRHIFAATPIHVRLNEITRGTIKTCLG